MLLSKNAKAEFLLDHIYMETKDRKRRHGLLGGKWTRALDTFRCQNQLLIFSLWTNVFFHLWHLTEVYI